MTPLVPITLYGWIFLTLIIFKTKQNLSKAISFSLVYGFIFLPVYSYDLPLINYNKIIAISFAILISIRLVKKKGEEVFKYIGIDYLMIAWFTIIPMMSSILNGLGVYDGLYNSIKHFFTWGLFYFFGRKYFTENNSIDHLVKTILIGTILYIPLCLIEFRMSPQLSNWIYGFFPHSFAQHVRNGGFRPIVFMQHGLMVSLWMAIGTNISFYYWKIEKKKKLFEFPSNVVFLSLFIITILTKSVGPSILMVLGISIQIVYIRTKSIKLLVILSLLPFIYIILRITGIINSNLILIYVSKHFSPERIQSLWFRLFQEDLYTINMKNHLIFGWGGWNRSAPIDPRDGQLLFIRDSMWLGIYSEYGISGLLSIYLSLLYGILFLIKKINIKENSKVILLSLIIVLFSLDTLLNSMVNPVYIVCSGALISYSQNLNSSKLASRSIPSRKK